MVKISFDEIPTGFTTTIVKPRTVLYLSQTILTADVDYPKYLPYLIKLITDMKSRKSIDFNLHNPLTKKLIASNTLILLHIATLLEIVFYMWLADAGVTIYPKADGSKRVIIRLNPAISLPSSYISDQVDLYKKCAKALGLLTQDHDCEKIVNLTISRKIQDTQRYEKFVILWP